jgi:ABC-type multidrug transport system ATPase subunit
MIIAKEIYKSFGTIEILKGCSFTINKGEVVGLVGLNGAGKTTLIRIMLSLISPTRGEISVFNNRFSGGEFFRKCGVTLENDGFNQNLSFRENIDFFIKAKRVDKYNANKYLERYFSHLFDKKVPIRDFSRGQRAQAALARAFIGNPSLIILDEPTATLDIKGIELFNILVRDSSKRDATIIISSHQRDTIESLCSSVILLEDGKTRKLELTNIDLKNYQIDCSNKDLLIAITKKLSIYSEINNNNTIELKECSRETIGKLTKEYINSGGIVYEISIVSRLKSEINYV